MNRSGTFSTLHESRSQRVPVREEGGSPSQGTTNPPPPHLPSSRLRGTYLPTRVGTPLSDRAAQRVLATWRVVCLLRSRRRTFLLSLYFASILSQNYNEVSTAQTFNFFFFFRWESALAHHFIKEHSDHVAKLKEFKVETAHAHNATSGTKSAQQSPSGPQVTEPNNVKQEPSVSDNSGNTYPEKRKRKPYKCATRGKKFATPKEYGNHMLLHHKQFKCMLCEKAFIWRQTWVKHKNMHDKYPELSTHELCAPESGPSKCDVCDSNLKRNSPWRSTS